MENVTIDGSDTEDPLSYTCLTSTLGGELPLKLYDTKISEFAVMIRANTMGEAVFLQQEGAVTATQPQGLASCKSKTPLN